MKTTLFTIFILLLVSSCQKQSESAPASFAEESMAAGAPLAADADAKPVAKPADTTTPNERMIIRVANLTLINDKPGETSAAIQTMTTSFGGFVVSSGSHGSDDVRSATLTLRVPSKKFDGVLAKLREKGEVDRESITGQDVTAEFVDVGARLTTQKNLERRFQELLLTASTVDDTIRVEQELARVRTEIERMEGRRNQLQKQAQMATINVTVRRDATRSETASEIGEALEDAGGIMAAVVAGLIRVGAALIPIAILLGIFVGLLMMFIRRRSKPTKSPKSE